MLKFLRQRLCRLLGCSSEPLVVVVLTATIEDKRS